MKRHIKLLCALVVSCFSVVNGLSGFISAQPVVFADEASTTGSDANDKDQYYLLPLVQLRSNSLLTPRKKTNYATNSSPRVSPSALLCVSSSGEKYVTLSVENWSLYDAFIPRKQEYNSKGIDWLPSQVFNDENAGKLTRFSDYKSELSFTEDSSEDVDGWYDFGDVKFGNITVKVDNNIDVAYVTMNIQDLNDYFTVTAWFNAPQDTYENAQSYYQNLYFYLNSNQMLNVSELLDGDFSVSNLTYSLRNSTKKADTSSISYLERNVITQTQDATAKNVIDSAIIAKENDKYTVKYHVNKDAEVEYSDFKLVTSISHVGSTWEEWDALYSGKTTELLVDSEGFINITYDDVRDALFGKYLYFETNETLENKYLYYTSASVVPLEAEDYEIKDDSGVYIKANTYEIPKNYNVTIRKNEDVYKYSNLDGSILSCVSDDWKSNMYSSAVWYTISATKEDGTEIYPPCKGEIHIPLPDDFNTDDYTEIIVRNTGSEIHNSQTIVESGDLKKFPGYDSESNEIILSNASIEGKTYAFLKYAPSDNVHDLKEDGIYKATAYFMKAGTDSTLSMADNGLLREAYIVVKNGKKKVYFNAKAVLTNTEGTACYIGDVFCDDINSTDSVYENSVVYTKFATDDDGKLLDNCGYNPITEYACIKGGILTLVDDCYSKEYNGYILAIASPAMSAMSGKSYSEISKDALQVFFKFSGLEKCDDSVTLETILNEGYGYDSTALLRKIKQTEIQFAATLEDEAVQKVLKHAEEVRTASYATLAEASNAYEAEINTLTDFAENYDANNYLSDGKYTITGKMVKADGSDTASMSDAAVNHTVVLNVKDGKYTAELEFKPIDVNGTEGKLQNLWYYTDYTINANGTVTGKAKEEATVAAKYDDGYPHYLDIELINKANYEYDYIPLHVYVPAMTGSEDQDVYLVLDWSTLAKADDISTLNGQSLTLPGVELPGFGLNFFMDFSTQTLADDGAKVVFTLPDGSTAEQLISESTKTENGYKFTALVNAKEMTVPVKAQVVLSNGDTGETYSCSVKKYADELLAMDGISEKTVKLVNALLNYGGYAQEYFGYETSDLANAGVPAMAAVSDADLEEYEMTVSGTVDGIEYYGSSLVLENSTAMNIYFKLADGKKATDFTFKAGKTTLTPTETGNGLCYVTVSGISAADLGAETTVSVGKLKVISSPYSYVYTALTKSQKEKLLNITKALYLYGEAAAAYVG